MSGKPGMTGPNMGGRRDGAGRPRTRFTIKVGDTLLLSRMTHEGVVPSELLTVVEIESGKIRFQCDDGIITLIR